MNQIQHDTIKTYLENDEQVFKELKTKFTLISEQEKKLNLLYDDLCNTLRRIREERKEQIDKMKSIYEQVEMALKATLNDKKHYVELIDTKIVPSLNGQLDQNKAKKANLLDYTTKLNIERQKEEKRNQNANDETKQKELYQALENAKREKMQAAQTMNTQYTIYVNEKNAETKAMFQHYLNSLLVICAIGLQEFSKTANFIHHTDERSETEQHLAQMLGNKRK